MLGINDGRAKLAPRSVRHGIGVYSAGAAHDVASLVMLVQLSLNLERSIASSKGF